MAGLYAAVHIFVHCIKVFPSVFCHCGSGDRKSILSVKNLCHLSSLKVLMQNEYQQMSCRLCSDAVDAILLTISNVVLGFI